MAFPESPARWMAGARSTSSMDSLMVVPADRPGRSWYRRGRVDRAALGLLGGPPAHRGAVGDEQRVGWDEVKSVGVVQVPGSAAGDAGDAVLPHDGVGVWVDDD